MSGGFGGQVVVVAPVVSPGKPVFVPEVRKGIVGTKPGQPVEIVSEVHQLSSHAAEGRHRRISSDFAEDDLVAFGFQLSDRGDVVEFRHLHGTVGSVPRGFQDDVVIENPGDGPGLELGLKEHVGCSMVRLSEMLFLPARSSCVVGPPLLHVPAGSAPPSCAHSAACRSSDLRSTSRPPISACSTA